MLKLYTSTTPPQSLVCLDIVHYGRGKDEGAQTKSVWGEVANKDKGGLHF